MTSSPRPFDPDSFAPPLRVPRLSAPPVVVRPFVRLDIDLVRSAAADPSILATSSLPSTYTHGVGLAFIERQRERAAEGDGYSFVIARHDDAGTGLGSIGLWLQEIESGRASIGYWLLERARGQGLASAALRCVVGFGFGQLAIPRLHLFVEPWNTASALTAEAAGFRYEATLRGWERIQGTQHDVDCYALLHTDWSPAP
jgi:RimJ/RimL family protein N-acetyltransferase